MKLAEESPLMQRTGKAEKCATQQPSPLCCVRAGSHASHFPGLVFSVRHSNPPTSPLSPSVSLPLSFSPLPLLRSNEQAGRTSHALGGLCILQNAV